MDKKQLAKEIVSHVGGKENIDQAVHCMTRLRFNLKNDELVNKDALQNLQGVMGTTFNGGQFQVIIGNEVAAVYSEVAKAANISMDASAEPADTKKNKRNPVSAVLDAIAGIFTPIIPALVAAGMLKALLALADSFHWFDPASGFYQIFTIVADGTFYFFPMLLAFSAAKKFKSNGYVALALAAAIMHPTLAALIEQGTTSLDFLGISLKVVNYSTTVVPIILSVWLMSYVERFFNKITPNIIKIIVVPTVTLAIMAPITFIFIGPLGSYLGDFLANGVSGLFATSGLLAGLILGGAIQPLVITGMHYGLIPLMIQTFAAKGYDLIMPVTFMGVMGQAGAILGVFLKTRNKNLKSLSGSTLVSSLLGITEPGIFGVTLRLKKPFIAGVIGGAAGGAIAGAFQTKAYAPGPSGLQALPGFFGDTFIYFVIAIIVSFTVGAVASYFLGFKDPEQEAAPGPIEGEAVSSVNGEEEIVSPLKGSIVPLSEVKDEAFSQEMMGKGVAILPSEGRVVSPVNGVVATVAKSKHSVSIISHKGAEVLIHVGMDTVKLKGQHFESFVKPGDEVKVGDVLLECNLEQIRQAGYEIVTPIIITNTSNYQTIRIPASGSVNKQDLLMKLIGQREGESR